VWPPAALLAGLAAERSGMMRHVIGLALLALVLAGAAEAKSTRYQCDFAVGNRRDGNWVPPVLVVNHDDGAPTALIYDPIIQNTFGKPIEGQLGDTSKVRTSFTWSLSMRDSENTPVTMNYTFIYYNNGRPAKVTVVPAGFDNRFSSEGTCVLKRG
jgi:hypothetical protein